jgi:hypothetical protein
LQIRESFSTSPGSTSRRNSATTASRECCYVEFLDIARVHIPPEFGHYSLGESVARVSRQRQVGHPFIGVLLEFLDIARVHIPPEFGYYSLGESVARVSRQRQGCTPVYRKFGFYNLYEFLNIIE